MWVVTDTLEECKLEESRQEVSKLEVSKLEESRQEGSKQGHQGSRKVWGECTRVE